MMAQANDPMKWAFFMYDRLKQKPPLPGDVRGPERIRTAVEAFAELCLATRPRNQFILSRTGSCSVQIYCKETKFIG